MRERSLRRGWWYRCLYGAASPERFDFAPDWRVLSLSVGVVDAVTLVLVSLPAKRLTVSV